ncbi:MAG TPA: hypothetical protein PKL77_09400 [Candidatus Omnitrophota bacterium]|nr:hypothetical protein [Candidatus Omnitrophota bacterium]
MPKKKSCKIKSDVKKLHNALKKDLKTFLRDESGQMSRENILKIGMGTITALTMFSGSAQAVPPPCDGQVTHLSDNTVQWVDAGGGVKNLVPSHTHHQAHCSY